MEESYQVILPDLGCTQANRVRSHYRWNAVISVSWSCYLREIKSRSLKKSSPICERCLRVILNWDQRITSLCRRRERIHWRRNLDLNLRRSEQIRSSQRQRGWRRRKRGADSRGVADRREQKEQIRGNCRIWRLNDWEEEEGGSRRRAWGYSTGDKRRWWIAFFVALFRES